MVNHPNAVRHYGELKKLRGSRDGGLLSLQERPGRSHGGCVQQGRLVGEEQLPGRWTEEDILVEIMA